MSGRYDIVFSKDFADDLRGIGGYVERVSGSPETSRRQLRRIRNAAKGLTSMPKRHPIIDEGIASQLGLRKATVANYAIFYRVDDESRKVLDTALYMGEEVWNATAGRRGRLPGRDSSSGRTSRLRFGVRFSLLEDPGNMA